MKIIKGNGVPRRNTEGSVGDTYLDLETGKRYSCVSSYRDSLGTGEFYWDPISDEDLVEEPIDGPSVEEDISDEESVDDISEDPESKPEWSRDNNRKQYNKHYKANRN